MNTGQIISGVGHLGLIGWMLFGGNFASEPLPFDVTDVEVISSAEFEAMLAGQNVPETVTEVAMPAPPVPDAPPTPDLNSTPDNPPEQAEPEVAETSPPDAPPDPVTPAPEPADIADQPPEIAPPPQDDVAVLVPQQSPRPQSRPVERLAPTPVARPPEPEIAPDPVVREETSDEPAEETRPDDEATAPPEAQTDPQPEANDEVTAAPTRSVRPQLRPRRPAAEPSEDTSNAVNAALAALQNEDAQGGEPTNAQAGAGSDPLTQGERDGLIVAIKQCWNVDPYAASGKVTVVVKAELDREGKIAGTPKFISASGGDQTATNVAFRNARSALIECGRRGFDLPEEKYEQWREIEITFNPEKMRLE
ncbi:energy transducer TonB [Alisedimentitalea sp. MJ-SS2]|uniref:energy transducer TonB n=1 Tax=Aliisedimentitalea sp. MJ-SS2 TaxID=3049795 RepID=UPI002915086F|nr:energy transducer TonB [Alisedimentitalea sp. MJ-SS2]MDU8925840.1 energy transducer TonB [Alisedimentitalea sp. MJ-SS2]